MTSPLSLLWHSRFFRYDPRTRILVVSATTIPELPILFPILIFAYPTFFRDEGLYCRNSGILTLIYDND